MKKLLLLFLFAAMQTKPMGLFGKAVVESNQNNSGLGDLALKVGVVGAATIGGALFWEKFREPVTNGVRKTLGLQAQPTVQELQTTLNTLQARLKILEQDEKEEDGQGPSKPAALDFERLKNLQAPGSPSMGDGANRRRSGSRQHMGNDSPVDGGSPKTSPERKKAIQDAMKEPINCSEED